MKQQTQENDNHTEKPTTQLQNPEVEPMVCTDSLSHSTTVGSLTTMESGWAACSDESTPSLLVGANFGLDFTHANRTLGTYPLSLNTSGDMSALGLFSPPSPNNSSPQSFGTSPISSEGSFADSYLLDVHELTLLKGLTRIAERLGCTEDVWSLTAQSPFTRGGGTPSDQLPLTWQPTSTQILLPHHPFLDFLPWPSVRDKAIGIFSLPEQLRPPSAAGPMGLANLAYDVEDNSEGVRIYGDNPYDPSCWEVGQVFFQRWWFLFDRDIISTSNRWRRLRGAPPLALTAAGEETGTL